jgi:hypothetical protein
MVRTQIYLTESQQKSLRAMAGRTGRKQSELIRDAIDEYVSQASTLDFRTLINKGVGLWQDRGDLPDFQALRREADRYSNG